MTAPRPVTRRAPGKLFITGEYSVMEPGTPALLIAVDRMVDVAAAATGSDGVVIASELSPDPVRLRWRGAHLAGRTPGDESAARGPLIHVVTALETVAELLAARGMPAPGVELTIRSDLHENGTKLGLGSSGAVTVAVIAATTARCGIALTLDERFRLAMIASARLDLRASGADLAASTWGGWIVYQAPDRAAVLDLVTRYGLAAALCADWPGCSVRSLVVPPKLTLAAGWTGRPVSTGELVGAPAAKAWHGSPVHQRFVAEMTECVLATVDALERGDCRSIMRQVAAAHRLLAGLDQTVGLGIFTDEIRALCAAADAVGWVAKPSGAGGGDCGIALRDNATESDVERLRQRWAGVGVRHLPVRVFSYADGDQMVSR